MSSTLAMTAAHHAQLRAHLFPGDGLEAAAVALCGRGGDGDHQRLVVNQVVLIPHEQCVRQPDLLTWPTTRLMPLLEVAERHGWAVVKLHSHPGGYPDFSSTDDRADAELFSSIHAWVGGGDHASAIMLPDGTVFGRAIHADGTHTPLRAVLVVGHDLKVFGGRGEPVAAAAVATGQVFGSGTVQRLGLLSVAVVGCSGTGSIMVEQLARLGIGRLILVDFDRIKPRNLNRILGSTSADAESERLKVDVLAEHVGSLGYRTEVVRVASAIDDPLALRHVSSCDVIVGCLDKLLPRALLTRLGTYYLQPYLDLGVRLVADGRGGINTVCGSVHYVQPGYSPLDARGVYRLEDLRAEGLAHTDPEAYRRQVAEKYIRGATEASPTVMPVNMVIASLAMNELLGRLHPYRTMGNGHTSVMVNLGEMEIMIGHHHERDLELYRHVGHGDVNPLLGMPELDLWPTPH
jgi:ThiF family/Prokaryotic homologs of the JAB domain